MNCYDVSMLIQSVDGELSEQEEQVLQAHLTHCEHCRSLYLSYRNIQQGIIELEEEPPEQLKNAVMNRIRMDQEKKRPIYILKRMRFTLIAAAACLLLIFAGQKLSFSSDQIADSTVAESNAATPMMIMDDTELRPAYDPQGEEAQASSITRGVQTAEAEIGDAEVAEDCESVGIYPEDDIEALQAVLEVLENDGYAGDLVEILDASEALIFEKFPNAEICILSDGTQVYRVAGEDMEAMVESLSIGYVVSTSLSGTDAFLYLPQT